MKVLSARLMEPDEIPHRCERRNLRGVLRQGIRYEKFVQKKLTAAYGDNYVPSPWIEYGTEAGKFVCQPDGLLFDLRLPNPRLTIIEIKLRHTAKAWWQVRELYEPVCHKLFEQWPIAACEITQYFDRCIYFPERYTLIPEPQRSPVGRFSVFILSMRGRAKRVDIPPVRLLPGKDAA